MEFPFSPYSFAPSFLPNIEPASFKQPDQAGNAVSVQSPHSVPFITHAVKRKFEDKRKDAEQVRSPLKKVKEAAFEPDTHLGKSRRSKNGPRHTDWTSEHDERLISLVTKYIDKWKQMAKIMAVDFPGFTKSSSACRYRWIHHLKPEPEEVDAPSALKVYSENPGYVEPIPDVQAQPVQESQEEDFSYDDPSPKAVEPIKESRDPIFEGNASEGFPLSFLSRNRQDESPDGIRDLRFNVQPVNVQPVSRDFETQIAECSSIALSSLGEIDSLF